MLWGRCYEGEGAPPYWPWVQAIRSYVRDADPEQLRSDMGAGAADIGQVVSDVGERLPGLETPTQLEPEQARFRLFDSITAFLKSAGRRQPLVLVLDDLHWADHPSLLLLEFVANYFFMIRRPPSSTPKTRNRRRPVRGGWMVAMQFSSTGRA